MLKNLKYGAVKFRCRIFYEYKFVAFCVSCSIYACLFFCATGEDDSLALKKKVTIEDVFGPDLHIHDPDARWLSGE